MDDDELDEFQPLFTLFLAFLYDYLMQRYEILRMMMNGMNFNFFSRRFYRFYTTI